MPKELSAQTIVAEVLSQWPETIPIFLDRHMNCVGCSMSRFETVRDAAVNHHMDMDTLLAALRHPVNEKPAGKIDQNR